MSRWRSHQLLIHRPLASLRDNTNYRCCSYRHVSQLRVTNPHGIRLGRSVGADNPSLVRASHSTIAVLGSIYGFNVGYGITVSVTWRVSVSNLEPVTANHACRTRFVVKFPVQLTARQAVLGASPVSHTVCDDTVGVGYSADELQRSRHKLSSHWFDCAARLRCQNTLKRLADVIFFFSPSIAFSPSPPARASTFWCLSTMATVFSDHTLLLAVLAGGTALIFLLAQKVSGHDPREPPLAPSSIPVIGHLVGMARKGFNYPVDLWYENHSPPNAGQANMTPPLQQKDETPRHVHDEFSGPKDVRGYET